MPGWATSLREFSTSNGCQNDTSSPSAALRLGQRLRRAKRRSSACHSSAHGPYDPPCHPLTSPDAAASTASRPALVTTRDRPSVGRDGERYRSDLGQAKTEIFLQIGLDRQLCKTPTDLPVGRNQLVHRRCGVITRKPAITDRGDGFRARWRSLPLPRLAARTRWLTHRNDVQNFLKFKEETP